MFAGGEFAGELTVANVAKQLPQPRTRRLAKRDQVSTVDQRFLQLRLVSELTELCLQKLEVAELAGGSEAVESVQCQLDREGRAEEQFAQRGGAHLLRVLQLHVMAHAGFHHSAAGLGEAQAVHDFQRHDGSNFFVSQKTDAPLIAALCRRLGDVVH
ncbi:uncharacterized protein METZ01_LOCUS225380 [marine metagenome]|uniref:Uncharacterized protein n=1 Tax=marine metagenome TaxID=408172 RepID=A0A382GBA2_9ZZZZ